jgi:seryl-tRNA synthetase
MLSAQFIRVNVDRVKRDILLRNTTADIDRILELDDQRKALLPEVEVLRAERNAVSKQIGQMKDKGEREAKIAQMREVGDRIDALDQRLKAAESEPRSARGPEHRRSVGPKAGRSVNVVLEK